MKMARKIKAGGTLALALMFAALSAAPGTVYGAAAIDTKKECTLTFDMSGTEFTELSGENGLPVMVHLYQVASVDENGRFTAEAPYQDALSGLDTINDQTSAEEWQLMAEEAAQIAEPKTEDKTPMEGAQTPGWTAEIVDGKGRIEGNEAAALLPGLYLVLAQPVESPAFSYTFQPNLVALPGNQYYETGADTWIYDVTMGLKPRQENRLGSLLISKTIDAYEPQGAADRTLFVFQVEVKKTEEGAAGMEERLYYSDVVAIDFDAAGTKTLEIPNLPAGAQATVTEVYSGASYTIPVQEATVQPDPIVADSQVTASFQNQYSGGLKGGSGVVNHFEHDGSTWNWTQGMPRQ